MRVTRIAVTGCVMAALTLAGATAAAAEQPPPSSEPGSVTVTLSAEQVKFLCDTRLPRMENRATKLVERINGGAEVKGSVAWLKARAQKERDAGRETTAQVLEERAERRAGRVDQLNKIKTWAADFRGKYCGAK
ncbi:hypothetical protein [Actinophytocola sp.]|uniref:hypothetical protein n=1 Tax=Actinophytocola sp. TaxID=1872138 RepID=UPI002D7EC205|nr:hypothetical protein [Actinophytocola sp.]HET9138703.1 hypothetical protein [Actinophytocola sp.]